MTEMRAQKPRQSQSPIIDLLHPSQYGPVQQLIMKKLDTKDILRLCQTCHEIRGYMKDGVWNINAKLERFVNNPKAFRSELGRCDALISGSFALQFLERVVWKESDLDIVVEQGKNMEDMATYLIEKEGYSSTTMEDFEEYHATEFIECRTYHKGREEAGNRVQVQLIASKEIPVQTILRDYYTSAVVNFITWNKAYAMFPQTTFLEHETVPLRTLDDHFGTLHAKYSQRGWQMRTVPPHSKVAGILKEFTGLPKMRRVGGRASWILSLDTLGVIRPSTPDYVLECAGFIIKEPWVEKPIRIEELQPFEPIVHRINAMTFKSNVLRYRYTYGPVVNLADLFETSTQFQMVKLTAAKRDEVFYSNHDRHELYQWRFEKPVGWDYWDDKLPGLLDRLELDEEQN